ncbi:MAG: transglycosylase domain-containing protein [Bdellovibrionales bacterium]|nr:transglycosylase domain-containing protein [Bdellovibrionales bacterium]
MVALESTGAFVLALIIALSQFVQPIEQQKLDQLLRADLTEAERAILEFTPKSIAELEAMNNEQLGAYLRYACGRLRNEVTRDDLLEATFQGLSLVDTVANLDLTSVFGLSERLLPNEEFDVGGGLRILIKACEYQDHRFALNVLTQHDLRYGLEVYKEFSARLPQWQNASDMPALPEIVRVLDRSGQQLGELVRKDTTRIENGEIATLRVHRREFAKSEEIPMLLKQAVVSVEDARFWNFKDESSGSYQGHLGVDLKGLMRAATSTASGGGVQGASTITMQLVKNYILYEDVHREYRLGKRSIYRKLNEYILARRLEELLTKDQILTLYLNTIDFGAGVQGVKMAARAYFQKELAELQLHELALLASLPKGPSFYNPWRNAERARQRRNYALSRMQSEGYVRAQDRSSAAQMALGVREFEPPNQVRYDEKGYYLAQVQNTLWSQQLSADAFTGAANEVTVHMDPELQVMAMRALQRGLLRFERASGTFRFRNTVTRLPNIEEAVEEKAASESKQPIAVFGEVLKDIEHPLPDATQFKLAVFLGARSVGFPSGRIVKLAEADAPYLRKTDYNRDGDFYRAPLQVWDVVLIEEMPNGQVRLAGMPKVTGAMIVVENSTGKVLASAGGFSLGKNSINFGPSSNLAFRAKRQPGSTLKPLLYLMAFEAGLSADTVVSNLPITFPERFFNGQRICDRYRPSAFSSGERPEISIERAFKFSRNLAAAHTLNLISGDRRSFRAQSLNLPNPPRGRMFTDLTDSLDRLWEIFQFFGVYEKQPHPAACFSSILGAEEVTPASLATAYATLARDGDPVSLNMFVGQSGSTAAAVRQAIGSKIHPYSIFQVKQLMRKVVKEGTGRRLADYEELVAGKTGTTNNNKDAWFAAITQELTVVTWVGYPENESLGGQGEGGKAAVPIFKDFFERYLEARPEAREKRFINLPVSLPNMISVRYEPRSEFYVVPGRDVDVAAYFARITGSSIPTVERQVRDDRLELIAPSRFELNNDEVFWEVMCDNLSPAVRRRVEDGYLDEYETEAREYHRGRRACEAEQSSTGSSSGASCQLFEELKRTTPGLCDYFYEFRAEYQ